MIISSEIKKLIKEFYKKTLVNIILKLKPYAKQISLAVGISLFKHKLEGLKYNNNGNFKIY